MPTDKTVAIVQSNYIPWKGYFDMIAQVDEFILYDDTQYTKRDWRNRNKIKTPQGLQWLSIPVKVKGKYYQEIKDTVIEDFSWGKKHWNTISHNYGKSEFFKDYQDIFSDLFLNCSQNHLSQINFIFLTEICKILNINTPITWSTDYPSAEGQNEKLISICTATNATHYISGPAAKIYMDEGLFEKNGITVGWMDYSGYPEYKQLHGEFEHGVSILDLIFNMGPNATDYMKFSHI